MGWYMNYEIEFEEEIEWDDEAVKKCLKNFDVEHLHLKDYITTRVIFRVYSHYSVEQILAVLKGLYDTPMRYRPYNSVEWTTV
jgi:hypothetical protein